jgi:hypothetical protein
MGYLKNVFSIWHFIGLCAPFGDNYRYSGFGCLKSKCSPLFHFAR